uniref:Boule n=1 Tax=Oopsacas minuta TaxID=111878 RepID=A0A1W5RSD2_9METZ|nr:boule [Oopsacas minuta]
MFHHTSSLAFTKQESVEFQHLQQSYVNSNQSNNDNIIYGVEIPNRVFVGGVPYDTTELELKNFFQSFGGIKDVKIITDRDGISKGYGFITFEREEQAIKMQGKKTIYYKEKKLNIGPAIRKQGGQFPKANQEFLTGQIKIFINSSHSPVYTPSSSDKISPMIYSLSPSHYMQSIPYCHHLSLE